jgi:hypothetical protein
VRSVRYQKFTAWGLTFAAATVALYTGRLEGPGGAVYFQILSVLLGLFTAGNVAAKFKPGPNNPDAPTGGA